MITNARVFSSEAAHYYWPDGRPAYTVPRADGKGERATTRADMRKLGLLPSPTTILKTLSKPELTNWLIEQACLAVLTAPRQPGEDIDTFVARVLRQEKQQDQERDAAAQRGTDIHQALADALDGREYAHPEIVFPAMEALRQLGRCVASEKVLVGDRYAGRTDAIFDGDTITVVDFKTCRTLPERGSWPDHKLQLAAYAAALGNTGEKRVHTANLYICTAPSGGMKLCVNTEWDTDRQRFIALLNYWWLL